MSATAFANSPVDEDGWSFEFAEPPAYDEALPVQKTEISGRPRIYLPSDETEITDSAINLMQIIAPKKELFRRGNNLVEVVDDEDERASLRLVTPDSFRSLAESHAELWVKVRDARSGGQLIEKPRRMSAENAKAIMGTSKAIGILPAIKTLASFPVMRRDGSIHSDGLDTETGILVTQKVDLQSPSLKDSVALLRGLLRDYQFASPADESRAIAALIAPMLRLGIWAGERVAFPIFFMEADKSQAGKGMQMLVIAMIYAELPAIVTQPVGGVGSFDESFSSALLKGRPIIQMDNLRGTLNSQILEAFVTAKGLIHGRSLRQEGDVDSRRFILYATSNGMESTEDTANRLSVTRIKKQPRGYSWHQWKEGSLLRHVEANRGLYIGAICTVLREWVEAGEPITDCHHDLREWAGASNWMVQNLFGLPPLMDGHDEVKERVSTPGLAFLREIALRIHLDQVTYTATDLVDMAQDEGIPIPGWSDNQQDRDALIKHMGLVLSKCFRDSLIVDVDAVTIERIERVEPRNDGKGNFKRRSYNFRRGVPTCDSDTGQCTANHPLGLPRSPVGPASPPDYL